MTSWISQRPATSPYITSIRPLCSAGQLHPPGRHSSGLHLTVASPSSHESFELVDFHAANSHSAGGSRETSVAGARRPKNVDRPFRPDTNSHSLVGLLSGQEAEKGNQDASYNPQRGVRFTRLRFWGEALRRRAATANESPVDFDSTRTGTMKFSHSIQFNAVPDWSSNYIAYSNLKKL